MANIKFSDFNVETDPTQIDALVGYQGTTMKQISPSNLGSVTSLNDLSDVSVNLTTDSAYFINIPAGLSGDSKNLVIGEGAANGFVNSNTSVVIGFDAFKTNTTQVTGSVVVGTEAMENVTSGQAKNLVAIGDRAGQGVGNPFNAIIIGAEAAANSNNAYEGVYIGKEAGKSANSNYQVFIGTKAGENANGATRAVAVGWNAGLSATGDDFVAVGYRAGRSNTATGTISIGYDAGYSQTSGIRNTNVGYKAGYTSTSNGSITNIGYEAGFLNTNTGTTNVGAQAGYGLNGGYNTTLGYRAGYKDGLAQSGQYSVYIGALAAYDNSGTANNNTAIGGRAIEKITTGSENTCIGKSVGVTLTTGSNNVLIGKDADVSAAGAANQIVIGQGASATADNQITLGNASITALRIPGLQSGASDGDVLTFSSGTGLITLQAGGGGGGASSLNGLSDCLVDTDSVYVAEVPSGLSGNPQGNTVLGIDAGNALTTGTNNTLIGNDAGLNLTTHFNTTAVGMSAGKSQNAESFNTYIGYQAGRDHIGAQSVIMSANSRIYNNGKNSNGVTAIGYSAHDVNAGNFSTAIGYSAGNAATGDSGTYVGRSAGRVNTSSSHVSVGHNAGYSQTSGTQNTNFGYSAGYSNTTGASRVMVGYEAGLNNTGSNNVFLGKATGKGAGSGAQVIAIGQGVMELGSQADNCVFIGNFMAADCNSGAGSTVAIGANCLSVLGYSGEGNTAIGHQAGNNLTSGDNNTLLGRNAGDAITTGTNNIMIGQAAEVSAAGGTNQIVIGQGSTGLGDNTTLLGNSSTATAAIRGNVGIGSDGDATAKLDVFGTDNIMKVRTTTGNGNTPQYLILFQRNSTSTGGNVSMNQYQTFFSTSSDYRLKENVTPITDGISRLKSLKPSRFNFISPLDENGNKLDPNPTVLDGFIAHEAQEIIPECVVGAKDALDENGDPLYQSIDQAKMVPLLTAALKEAVTKIEQLETRIQTLENN